jgi:hypothetical protein
MMSHLIVGAGGTASWLVPLLKRMTKFTDEITVLDGDILEERNLDRQLFDISHLGWNKAEALAHVYNVNFFPCYLEDDPNAFLCGGDSWGTVWCCADNHLARKIVLEMVDQGLAKLAIIGGNEFTDSEAYGYLKAWKGTAGDPRIYYPEILTDLSNDPNNPSCQGQAQANNRQLALANYLSAGMMMHLWYFITNHGHEVNLEHWPARHFSNFAGFFTKPYA